jgi:hypothetical protein
MFIVDYLRLLNTGTRKEAFDASKVLSDIVAMANRAAWIFGFSIVASSARIGLIGSVDFRWWETAAFTIIEWLCGYILPTLLSIQIYLVAFADIRTIGNRWVRYPAWALLLVTLVCVYGSVAIVSMKITEEFHLRQRTEKENSETALWLTLTERQNQQTSELLRELKPEALSKP